MGLAAGRELPMATEVIAVDRLDRRASPVSAVPRRARLLYSVSSFGNEALSRNRDAWFLYY